jgi:hypothetical protein
MRFQLPPGLKSRLESLGEPLGVVFGLWFLAAFVCLFFDKGHPVLHSIAIWTFRLYFGVFIAFIATLMIVGPGIYTARELFDWVEVQGCSRLELYLTWVWAGFAGLLLTTLLGTAAVLMALGILAYVKLWFISVCWIALLIPWWLIGYLGRTILRRYYPVPARQFKVASKVGQ